MLPLIFKAGNQQEWEKPAEDGDGEGVCDDADDGHDEGGVPAQVQGDLPEQVEFLLCRLLRFRCLVNSQNILLLGHHPSRGREVLMLKENQGKL